MNAASRLVIACLDRALVEWKMAQAGASSAAQTTAPAPSSSSKRMFLETHGGLTLKGFPPGPAAS
jgi:hypothetical protein